MDIHRMDAPAGTAHDPQVEIDVHNLRMPLQHPADPSQEPKDPLRLLQTPLPAAPQETAADGRFLQMASASLKGAR
jgi:hypothetical protein